MQIISEAQILQISAQHALCFPVQEDSCLEGVTGEYFLARGWVVGLCPSSVPCCGFQAMAGGSWEH